MPSPTTAIRVASLFILACFGCDDDDAATTGLVCGQGTVDQDGVCVPAVQGTPPCGEGTLERDGVCVAADDGMVGAECGEGTIEEDGVCVVDPLGEMPAELKPRVERMEITRLVVTGEPGPFHPHHTIDVSVEIDADAESFQAEALIGMKVPDEDLGCFFGTVTLRHNSANEVHTHLQVHREFVIPESCAMLVGRDDLEVYVAFDPWGKVNLVDQDRVLPFADDCEADEHGPHPDECRTALRLEESPGLDLELLEVSLDSTVLVLPRGYGDHPGSTVEDIRAAHAAAGLPEDGIPDAGHPPVAAATPDHPHLYVSAAMRILGAAEDEHHGDDTIHYDYRIRPRHHAPGTRDLAAEDTDWFHLSAQQPPANEADDPEHHTEDHHEDLVGNKVHNKAAAIYAIGEVAERLNHGVWSHIDEFELNVCLNADFDEAVFEGFDAPKRNNCALFPLIIVRQDHGPYGHADDGSTALDGAADTWSKDKLEVKIIGTDEAELELNAWLSIGATKSSGRVDYGFADNWGVQGPFGWWEAGADAWAEVYGQGFTLAFGAFSFQDYQAPGDLVSLEIEVFTMAMIPFFELEFPDGRLTLLELLNAVGKGTLPTEKQFKKNLLGESFDVPCGGFDVGLGVFLTFGIDPNATFIEKAGLPAEPATCVGQTLVGGGDYCIQTVQANRAGVHAAKDLCSSVGGYLPFPTSEADIDALGRNGLWFSNLVLRGLPAATYYYLHAPPGAPPAAPIPVNLQTFPGYYATTMWNRGAYIDATHAGLTGPIPCYVPRKAGVDFGTSLTVVIQPHIATGVEASAEIDFSFLAVGFTITLNLLDFSTPFTGGITQKFMSDAHIELALFRMIQAQLQILNGDIRITIDFSKSEFGKVLNCIGALFGGGSCNGTGSHVKTLAIWDGIILGPWNILAREDYPFIF